MVRKIAAGIPAFTQMERDGILDTLDSQHRAAEQLHMLVAQAAAAGFAQAQERSPGPQENRACPLGIRLYGAAAARIMFEAERTEVFGAVSLLLC